MDGFGAPTGPPVIVLAATNLVDYLDEALKRRFDRTIEVDKPDRAARLAYLKKVFSQRRQAHVSDTVLERIAEQSAGMTIANLENIIQEAGIMAAQSGQLIDDALLEEAFEKTRMGEAKKLPDNNTLLRVARHEAGHTFVAWKGGNRPYQVTIVGRGNAGGYMEPKTDEDRLLLTKAEIEQTIREYMGGRAGEIIYYGEEEGLSTGVSGDLKAATWWAKQMVREYGMAKDIGQIALDQLANRSGAVPLNEETAKQVEAIVSRQLEEAISLIKDNSDVFDRLVDRLIEKNRLAEEELAKILDE